MQAMLLAAGFGTRLRPYTLLRPKPLFPVCNVPLLHILLDKLAAAGCRKTVVNGCHLAGQIAAAVSGRPEVVFQHETEILGTGGSLRQAAAQFEDGPVLVMNGDIYHDIALPELLAAHTAGGHAVTMALHDCPRFNTVRTRGSRVCGFGQAKAGETLLAFTGIHVVEREVLRQIPAAGFFHIIDLYAQLAEAGQVGLLRVDGCFWQDIGTPADYLDLHRRLLADKTSSWVISSQVAAGNGAVFRDWGAVGPGAVIGAGAQLARCVVWENAVIPPGAELADQIVLP
ncbi:MAG: sugar phosphate nucleotidyltransferase [Candidatus Electronema sp. V4]|uniref:sugar phosphate nucleotidyltransferase n=1 Tax=Candidatus Electronema sp. V4 TaxID=3454756 RepID=UPI0040556748